MSIAAQWTPLDLDFAFEAVTSRERMWHRRTYLVRVWDTSAPQVRGVGECGLFRGLSADDTPDYEERLAEWCSHPEDWRGCTMPSVRFGLETAFADLAAGGRRNWTDNNDWLDGRTGIPINGLIWMGDRNTMFRRIQEKIEAGFKVLKLKIGGINFEEEVELLRYIRSRFGADELEIRLDANGSMSPADAPGRLERLSAFDIHSIEQPVRAGLTDVMARLCRTSPVAIALDEELIGWKEPSEMEELLTAIRPQHIILKPSLIGGFEVVENYVALCRRHNIGWWLTSALESNVGLNAIAQWTATEMSRGAIVPQGLGTGMLYTNNISSPLTMRGGSLCHKPGAAWGDLNALPWR